MAWYDIFRRRRTSSPKEPDTVKASALEDRSDTTHTYDDRNITFSGELADYDYEAILRDKQHNIVSLYELADYFVDADPLVHGIIKGVYTPFSVSPWKLVGPDEKIKQKYEEYYERIHLQDRLTSIFYQYYKYGNVYIYLQEDGNIVTLPVHKTRISNIMINGEPVLEFNAGSVRNDIFIQGQPSDKHFVDDDKLEVKLFGLPPEVGRGLKENQDWVQLDPRNTFVLQGLKEDWVRYAIPMIASMLSGLKKKSKVSKYEDSLLNLGINSFIHVRYGSEKSDDLDLMPNREELGAVQSIFRAAMKGGALAVTNSYAKAEVIQGDTDDLFEDDKYKDCNSEILSAGGISGIIVSGIAGDGSTFASAQVSINTADKRIEHARNNFCELMNKINLRVNGDMVTRSKNEKIPLFEFEPVDLSGSSKFQKTCLDLWKQGCLSTETMLDAHGFSIEQEAARKQKEIDTGVFELLKTGTDVPEESSNDGTTVNTDPAIEVKVGRPEVEEEERTSDISKSYTGKQPKPSNPDGSLEDSGL